jgi:hypothetical protein
MFVHGMSALVTIDMHINIGFALLLLLQVSICTALLSQHACCCCYCCCCCCPAGIYVHGPASCGSCQAAIQARCKARTQHADTQTTPQQQEQQQQQDDHASSRSAAQQQQQQAQEPDQALAEAADNAAQQQKQKQQQQQQQQIAPAGDAPCAADFKPCATGPKPRVAAPKTQLQHGVLRTNCIDCLDRTNVAQFAYGLAAFGRQLAALGVLDVGAIDSDSSIAFQLMEMYEAMGHTLALQVGDVWAANQAWAYLVLAIILLAETHNTRGWVYQREWLTRLRPATALTLSAHNVVAAALNINFTQGRPNAWGSPPPCSMAAVRRMQHSSRSSVESGTPPHSQETS